MQGIHIVSSEGGEPKEVIEVWRDVRIVSTGISLSPLGNTLAFTSVEDKKQHIFTISIDGGESKQLVEAQAREPVYSPDGKRIAYMHTKTNKNYTKRNTETNIYVIPAIGGDPVPLTMESDSVDFGSIAWSPDGEHIAYFSYNEENPDDKILKIISVENRDSHLITKVQGINVHNELAWSPDSKRIAFNGPKDIISVVSIKDGSIEEINTDLMDVSIYHFDWSPNGDRFVFAGYKGGGPEFWLMEDFLPKTEAKK